MLGNEDVVGLKTDSNVWKIGLLVISSVTALVLPVRYVIFMIQRRSGTLRLCMKSSEGERFQWHFREFEADYCGSGSHEYHVQLQRQLNLKER